jgi:hypothetical protein
MTTLFVAQLSQQRPLYEFGLPGNVDQIEYNPRSH